MSEGAILDDGDVIDTVSIAENNMDFENVAGDDLQQYNNEENLYNEEERGNDVQENWKVVGREKRRKTEKIDICVTSLDKLPKQFALAKLFHAENIVGINRVKFVNAFKVIVTFDNEVNAEKLLSCKRLHENGWRIQKTWEVNASYGIIRDIDIDLSETDLLECIKNCNNMEILSVKRLNRRNSESAWLQSETVRLCFKGNLLPPYIKILNLRVAVVPYVFSVTQCSRCWRFGHTIKLCPSIKVICPKCGKDHQNCETTTFKCVNCGGNHMSLIKTCPSYLKEKKIRSLMSEFNCTYRRAMDIYVPPFSPRYPNEHNGIYTTNMPVYEQNQSSPMSYAGIVTNKQLQSNITEDLIPRNEQRREVNKRKQRSSSEQLAYEANESSSSDINAATNVRCALADERTGTEGKRRSRRRAESIIQTNSYNHNQRDIDECTEQQTNESYPRSKSVEEVINKIRQIIFSQRLNLAEKIKNIISVCVEWCVSAVLENFNDFSIFKKTFDIIFNSQNG